MFPPSNCPFANDFLITHALGHMMCDMSTPCHKSPVTSFIHNICIYIYIYIYIHTYIYIYTYIYVYIDALLINALISNYNCLIK